jgi:hypothetical protein
VWKKREVIDAMKISYSRLLNIVLVAILATSIFFMNTRSTIETKTASAGTYDPWLDTDDNGIINMLDLYYTAISYGATGDPTKNVNVTNWQISKDVNVFWEEDVSAGSLTSPAYSAGGFGHLHILAHGSSLNGDETIQIWVRARLYNATRTSYYPMTVYTITLTPGTGSIVDVSMSVPSDTFYFLVPYNATVVATVSLSFYLTWA